MAINSLEAMQSLFRLESLTNKATGLFLFADFLHSRCEANGGSSRFGRGSAAGWLSVQLRCGFWGVSFQKKKLPETNEHRPLKINGWTKMYFLLGPSLFSGVMLVSGSVVVWHNYLGCNVIVDLG